MLLGWKAPTTNQLNILTAPFSPIRYQQLGLVSDRTILLTLRQSHFHYMSDTELGAYIGIKAENQLHPCQRCDCPTINTVSAPFFPLQHQQLSLASHRTTIPFSTLCQRYFPNLRLPITHISNFIWSVTAPFCLNTPTIPFSIIELRARHRSGRLPWRRSESHSIEKASVASTCLYGLQSKKCRACSVKLTNLQGQTNATPKVRPRVGGLKLGGRSR